jgi:hypothetical protein
MAKQTDFTGWALADNNGRTVAHTAAWKGHLPPDFTDWALADRDGTTVAHMAAWFGHLPSAFTGWALADNNGRTVAHAAARTGHLPAGMDRAVYKLADNNDWTVAHEAARYGHLPPDFERWDMVDGKGRTVAGIAADNYPPDSALGTGARKWLARGKRRKRPETVRTIL